MRLLLAVDLTARGLARLLLLLVQLTAAVALTWWLLGPAAGIVLAVLLVWTLRTLVLLGQSR
jgi:hypothetical protein